MFRVKLFEVTQPVTEGRVSSGLTRHVQA
jgi:hypothetical protein